MARFNASEIDNYGGQGGGGFFSLKNDKEVARIRLMYNSIDDVEGYSVHRVPVDDNRYVFVNCLREYNDKLSKCPFCQEARENPAFSESSARAKLFIPIYNIDEDRAQIWERGKKFYAKLSSIMSRYPNTVSHVFEVERNGKPKDTQTTYELYEVEADDTTLDDLPEVQDLFESGLIKDKSADDMNYYLEEGVFPPDESEEQEEAPRRRSSRAKEDEPEEVQPRNRGRNSEERTGRRTPANSRHGRNDDKF